MASQLLRNLITYVLTELRDMDASFGKTKLVKLLYLIDTEHHRRYRRGLSDLEWVFYHYGPYAFDIDEALKELQFDVPQETVTVASGHEAFVFRPPRWLQARLEPDLLYRAKPIIDSVLREWGMEDINPILNHVYFYTEPMKVARRGEVLNFGLIEPRRIVPERPPVELPADQVSHMRDRLDRIRQVRAGHEPATLTPQPRFDQVYEDALRRLDADNQYSVPDATIDMEQDEKESLREQREP